IDADHVSQRFGHLLRFHVDQAVVHPIADEWRLARIRFRLRNFVFVVRKHQIQAAAVEVDVISQVFEGHGRALDVPSRAALPPGALPRRLARFGRFPQGEVHRIAFAFIGFETGARHQLVETLSAQSAVIGKARHVEKDVPVHGVGEAFFHQRLDHLDDVGNMLAHPRIMVRILNAQPPHGGQILVGEAGRQPERILSFGARSVDDLVVHVGEVLHQRDTIAPRPQKFANHRPDQRRPGMADVRFGVRRDAAGVNPHVVIDQRLERFLRARQRIVDADRVRHHPFPPHVFIILASSGSPLHRRGVYCSPASRAENVGSNTESGTPAINPSRSARSRSRASSSRTRDVKASICRAMPRSTFSNGSGKSAWSRSMTSTLRPSCRPTRPGPPTPVELGGTSDNTTEPAPILALSPTRKEPSTAAPVAMTTLFPMVGWRLPFSLPVPPSTTPWYNVTFSPSSAVSPMTTPMP